MTRSRSFVAIQIVSFGRELSDPPQAEKYSLLYLSIRSVEVALICKSNNKLSFDALYLYMVKTYDPAVANLFPI